jgi:hydroxymethylpyrimidine pyrophosphatase-like HAD family hydrolase
MIFRTLALDFDGTLSSDGKVEKRVLKELKELKRRAKLILVTGRCAQHVSRFLGLFDAVVAENGCVVLHGSKKLDLSPTFWKAERSALLSLIGVNGCEEVVISIPASDLQKANRVLGERASVILNKDRAMIVPKGFTKATGLLYAMKIIRAKRPLACIGDGENDEPMLKLADIAVCVENAVQPLKPLCHVLVKEDGKGMLEFLRCVGINR